MDRPEYRPGACALTSGERTLWAIAYERAIADRHSRTTAVRMACAVVEEMRDIRSEDELWEELDGDERCMVSDMLGEQR